LFTSPPYGSFRSGAHDDGPEIYLADARRLFAGFARLLAPGATVAVEVSQLRQGDQTRPLVWQLGGALSEIFTLREDLVRVNTGGTEAGPGYDHSHVLVFGIPGSGSQAAAPAPAAGARLPVPSSARGPVLPQAGVPRRERGRCRLRGRTAGW